MMMLVRHPDILFHANVLVHFIGSNIDINLSLQSVQHATEVLVDEFNKEALASESSGDATLGTDLVD